MVPTVSVSNEGRCAATARRQEPEAGDHAQPRGRGAGPAVQRRGTVVDASSVLKPLQPRTPEQAELPKAATPCRATRGHQPGTPTIRNRAFERPQRSTAISAPSQKTASGKQRRRTATVTTYGHRTYLPSASRQIRGASSRRLETSVSSVGSLLPADCRCPSVSFRSRSDVATGCSVGPGVRAVISVTHAEDAEEEAREDVCTRVPGAHSWAQRMVARGSRARILEAHPRRRPPEGEPKAVISVLARTISNRT